MEAQSKSIILNYALTCDKSCTALHYMSHVFGYQNPAQTQSGHCTSIVINNNLDLLSCTEAHSNLCCWNIAYTQLKQVTWQFASNYTHNSVTIILHFSFSSNMPEKESSSWTLPITFPIQTLYKKLIHIQILTCMSPIT